jgi:CBS domain-containing protein
MEPIAFARSLPPFETLDAEAMRRVEKSLEIEYFARGAQILRRDGEPSKFLYIVRKGAVRLERAGRVLELLEEGDLFGYPSILSGRVNFDSIAEEDVLAYRIPAALFLELLENSAFSEYFLRGIGERLRRMPSPMTDAATTADLTLAVSSLVEKQPVFVPQNALVSEAAQVMSAHEISSVLIDGDPPGILTDRDLRKRVLAAGRGPQTPVREVMSAPLLSLPEDASLLEALLFMLESGVHHLPLTRDGRVSGMVTDTSLLRHYARSPMAIVQRLERTSDADALTGYASRVQGVVEGLLAVGVKALEIGRVVSTLNDKLVRSLLRSAEQEMGPPPCDYAWVVYGSEGRLEQALLTDQDNALIYAEESPAAREYFQALARRAVDGLLRAGFPMCPGGYVATEWCEPLAEWITRFRSWIEAPTPQGLLDASNVFDLRSVHGLLDLTALETIRRSAVHAPAFLAQFAHSAMAFKPPLGLFRSMRDEDGHVDVKKGAITPIVGLARVLALAVNSDYRATAARLEAAGSAGELSPEDAENLREGFDFVLGLRLRTQLAAIRAGEAPSNRVRLDSLSARDRRLLKDTFVAVRELQAVMAQRFPSTGLGWERS